MHPIEIAIWGITLSSIPVLVAFPLVIYGYVLKLRAQRADGGAAAALRVRRATVERRAMVLLGVAAALLGIAMTALFTATGQIPFNPFDAAGVALFAAMIWATMRAERHRVAPASWRDKILGRVSAYAPEGRRYVRWRAGLFWIAILHLVIRPVLG